MIEKTTNVDGISQVGLIKEGMTGRCGAVEMPEG